MKIKKVLVSQPKPASEKSPYYDIAEKYGVKIDFRPFIKVESVSAKEFRQQKVSILDHTAVIFTSRHAIDHFFHLCTELRVTIPETMKYFCVTEAVALYIQKYVQYRKRKIFFGATGKIEDLIPSIVKHKTEKYLVPMSDVHNDDVRDLSLTFLSDSAPLAMVLSFLKVYLKQVGIYEGWPEYASLVSAACLMYVIIPLILYMIFQRKFVRSIDRVGITG